MINFIRGFVGILILEWAAIAEYISLNSVLSLEILRIRCILMMYIFVQLRQITFAQKQKAPPVKVEEKHPEIEITVPLKECTDTVKMVP
jgi:hypothetical protein